MPATWRRPSGRSGPSAWTSAAASAAISVSMRISCGRSQRNSDRWSELTFHLHLDAVRIVEVDTVPFAPGPQAGCPQPFDGGACLVIVDPVAVVIQAGLLPTEQRQDESAAGWADEGAGPAVGAADQAQVLP